MHQTRNLEEMGDFLVKININKIEPKIKYICIQTDELAIQDLFPLSSPLIVLRSPYPRTGKEQEQNHLESPLISTRFQCLHLPWPCSAQ